LKRNPITYVNVVALAIAFGTTREGSLASSAILISRVLAWNNGQLPPPPNVPSSTISTSHYPRRGQTPEQERESGGVPPRGGLKVGERIFQGVFILGLYQEKDTGTNQRAEVKDDIAAGQSIQPFCGQRVDRSVKNRQQSHDRHDVACRWDEGEVRCD